MGPQHQFFGIALLVQIEGVVHLPGRMFRRNVQGGEIMEVVFDVGAFGDRKAHVGEDCCDFLDDLAHRMNFALCARPRGQGHINGFATKARRHFQLVQFRPPGFKRRCDLVFCFVKPLAQRFTVFRRRLTQGLHQSGDRAFATQGRNPQIFQRPTVFGVGDLAQKAIGDRIDVIHGRILANAQRKRARCGPVSASGLNWPFIHSGLNWPVSMRLRRALGLGGCRQS